MVFGSVCLMKHSKIWHFFLLFNLIYVDFLFFLDVLKNKIRLIITWIGEQMICFCFFKVNILALRFKIPYTNALIYIHSFSNNDNKNCDFRFVWFQSYKILVFLWFIKDIFAVMTFFEFLQNIHYKLDMGTNDFFFK